MKIIITEGQSDSLIYNILADNFTGYKMKFEGDGRNIYVDGQVMMTIYPNRVVIDKSIINHITDTFFFDDIRDLKKIIREWVVENFGVKRSSQTFFGVQFKDLSGNSTQGNREMRN
jgi:hypothetical protein